MCQPPSGDLPCVYFYVGRVYNTQTVSVPDWSQPFTFTVCSLLTLPILLLSRHNCVREKNASVSACVCMCASACLRVVCSWVLCSCVIPPYVCVSDHWTVTSLAYGMMAVITTFQRAPIGSIKMS